MPLHHPSLDLLCAVAAGQLSAGLHKILLAHASLCPTCRAVLDRFEAIGGAILENEPGEVLSAGALDRALAAVAAEPRDNPVAATPDWLQQVPPGVRDLAADVARASSSKGGVSLSMMQAVGTNRETMELVRIEPGGGIPDHAHDGMEYTLVLTGVFRDQRGVFAQGDLAISDENHTHRPVAEPGETCIALIVATAALRFKGPLGLLQRVMTLGRG